MVNSKIKNVYGKQEKQRIAKFASQHGHEAAVRKFKKMSRPLLKVLSDLGSRDLKENLKEKRKANKEVALKIGQTRSRPLLLDVCLDSKLRGLIISLKTVGAGINQHVIRGVLIVLVQPYPEKFVKYVTLK